jgi:hypothetical protein
MTRIVFVRDLRIASSLEGTASYRSSCGSRMAEQAQSVGTEQMDNATIHWLGHQQLIS